MVERARRRGGRHGFLTLLASLALVFTAVVAGYVVHPVDWDSRFGRIGAFVLMFPLHVLLAAVVTGVLWILAGWRRARLAAWMFGVTTVLIAVMAIWPMIAMWRMARRENVPVLLSAYLVNARFSSDAGTGPDTTVVYGTTADGTKLVLDVWRADSTTRLLRHAVVKVHGGAWTHGDRTMNTQWNRWLNWLGYDVFDVEYRLPPPDRWRDEVGDVKCALGWVATNAARYHIDPAHISLQGSAAGGNLAMLAAYSMNDSRLPSSCKAPSVQVRSIINLYGPADLALLYTNTGSSNYVQGALDSYIGGPVTQFPDRYKLVSPLSHVSAKSPPTITLLGTSDRIVPENQARVLQQALDRSGVQGETWLLPYGDHGFDGNWGAFSTQFAREKVAKFLRKHG